MNQTEILALAPKVKQRLLKMAREVDGLNWGDRMCIGQAISLIDAATLMEPAALPAEPVVLPVVPTQTKHHYPQCKDCYHAYHPAADDCGWGCDGKSMFLAAKGQA